MKIRYALYGYSCSSSDSELERKKRKAKKALEDLAAAAGLLRGESKLNAKPEPVPPPSYVPTSGAAGMPISGAGEDDDDYPGKWRPMALRVNLGRASDEPEVEESRMVYMKEEKRVGYLQPVPPVEPEEETPPGNYNILHFRSTCTSLYWKLLSKFFS